MSEMLIRQRLDADPRDIEALLAMGESLTAAWPAMPMPPGAQVDD